MEAIASKGWRMKNKWQFRLGIIVVLISIGLFFFLVAIPFLPVSVSLKVKISAGDLIAAEILFYSGSFLVGKEVVTRYRQKLNPKNWFKRKPGQDPEQNPKDRNR
jgi:hypothetical protein